MKIGFIGLGNMGAPMARNLVKAGHELKVYNRTRHKAEDFAREGAAAVADTPAQAADGAEVVITMVADDQALRDVMHGHGGAFDALAPGAVHISMSTISVALSRAAAAHHTNAHKIYVAAPVFGRPDAAAAAKLFVVAAGGKHHLQRCQPLFDVVGQRTFVIGEEPHTANVVKLIGNFLITTVIESLAESFALVQKSGVERSVLLDLLTSTLFNAPIYKNYGAMIAADKYEPVGFRMPLGLKDNRLILNHADECSVPMPMASLVHDRYLAAIAQGLSDADWSAMALMALRSAGVKTGGPKGNTA
jgi:3-hydroxyisobutyrate dehydrogenase-like beta-hydroxyacid dehydrogenase